MSLSRLFQSLEAWQAKFESCLREEQAGIQVLFCQVLNVTHRIVVVQDCFCRIANFMLCNFRDTSLAGHRHHMQVMAQQSLRHFSGSSDHMDTVSLSAAGGLAKEEIACGPVSTIKVRRT